MSSDAARKTHWEGAHIGGDFDLKLGMVDNEDRKAANIKGGVVRRYRPYLCYVSSVPLKSISE